MIRLKYKYSVVQFCEFSVAVDKFKLTDTVKRFSRRGNFKDSLLEPLPFKIPLCNYDHPFLSKYPIHFTRGQTECETNIDDFLNTKLTASAKMDDLLAFNKLWLEIIQKLTLGTIYSNHLLMTTDEPMTIPLLKAFPTVAYGIDRSLFFINDVQLTISKKLIGDGPIQERLAHLPPETVSSFPPEQLFIPGFVTSKDAIQLFSISLNPLTQQYVSEKVKSYNLRQKAGRCDFIVDIFKLICWISSFQKPIYSDKWPHLLPAIVHQTRNGHLIGWTNSGLLKIFKRSIQLSLYRQVLEAKLKYVEQGWVDEKSQSIVITSSGWRLHRAIRRRPVLLDQATILSQVRTAIDSLHAIGIAHCDICHDNIWISKTGDVILGDLEYCTKLTDPPPQVRRMEGHLDTAQELDEQQFEVFRKELPFLFA